VKDVGPLHSCADTRLFGDYGERCQYKCKLHGVSCSFPCIAALRKGGGVTDTVGNGGGIHRQQRFLVRGCLRRRYLGRGGLGQQCWLRGA
jgi:hypothetical protein